MTGEVEDAGGLMRFARLQGESAYVLITLTVCSLLFLSSVIFTVFMTIPYSPAMWQTS